MQLLESNQIIGLLLIAISCVNRYVLDRAIDKRYGEDAYSDASTDEKKIRAKQKAMAKRILRLSFYFFIILSAAIFFGVISFD